MSETTISPEEQWYINRLAGVTQELAAASVRLHKMQAQLTQMQAELHNSTVDVDVESTYVEHAPGPFQEQ